MAEPEDVVVPILRNIQTNISRLEGKIDNQGEMLLEVSERVEAMQGLMHYHLGMTTEQQHLIATIPERDQGIAEARRETRRDPDVIGPAPRCWLL